MGRGRGHSKQSIGFRTERYKVEVQQCDLHQTWFHSHLFQSTGLERCRGLRDLSPLHWLTLRAGRNLWESALEPADCWNAVTEAPPPPHTHEQHVKEEILIFFNFDSVQNSPPSQSFQRTFRDHPAWQQLLIFPLF